MGTIQAFAEMFRAEPFIWIAFSAFVGACFASFGGVLVDRLPHIAAWRINPKPGMSLMTPSRCDSCKKRVALIPAIPVLGWLIYRGRCSCCGAKVPAVYPVMESVAAIASAIWAAHFGPTMEGALGLVALWSCIILAWMDWKEAWLPDRILVPLLMLGLLASPFAPSAMDRIEGCAVSLGAIWLTFAWITWRRGEDYYAAGDMMFCAMAGAWLGLHPVPVFLIVTCGLYALHYVFLKARKIAWTPPEAEMQPLLGDSSGFPLGPSLVVSFLGLLWWTSLI